MIKVELIKIDMVDIIRKHSIYIEEVVFPRVSKKLTKKNVKFLTALFGDKNEQIKTLISFCTSHELITVLNNFELVYKAYYGRDFYDDINSSKEENYENADYVRQLINSIFMYSAFNKGTEDKKKKSLGWNRHSFLSSLNIKVCPYCNRNYITIYEKNKLNITTAQGDHYYPISLYPVLQLNIYNLIPCCYVCNSHAKRDSDLRHLYPYTDSSNSLKFYTPFNEIEELYNFDEDKVKINILEKANKERAKNSIEVFKLRHIYEIHNDIVFELKNKIRDFYGEFYNSDSLNRTYGIRIDEDIIYDYIFDFLRKKPINEPLIKLKQDIYYQIMKALDL